MYRALYPIHCFLPFDMACLGLVQISGEYIIFRLLKNEREARRQRAEVTCQWKEVASQWGENGARGGAPYSSLREAPSRWFADTVQAVATQ